MKRIIIASLFVASSASAQIPVTDTVGIFARGLEHIDTILRWKEQYDQLSRQYDQLRATHESLTGVRNLGDVFDDPRLRRLLPDDMQAAYSAFRRSGYEGLLRKGVDIHNENQVFEYCSQYEDNDLRINCESKPAHAAQTNADALEALDIITERGEQITQLQQQINTTEDTKAIAELQARIAIEQTSIQNEATRLAVIQMLSESQQRLDADRQRQLNARAWSGTKGVQAEAPTFD